MQLHANVHVSVYTHTTTPSTHTNILSLVYPYGENAKNDSYKYTQQGGGGKERRWEGGEERMLFPFKDILVLYLVRI